MEMKMTHETISAFTDGELRAGGMDAVLTELREPQGRGAWDMYQRIGDVLRSEDLVRGFRPGFEARLFARLDAEPTILMPAGVATAMPAQGVPVRGTASNVVQGDFSSTRDTQFVPQRATRSGMRRFFMPGAAAAAVATIAFMTAPQMMVALTKTPGTFASAVTPSGRVSNADIKLASTATAAAMPVVSEAEHGDVLRDPGLDEYLMAHQRFSPSVYSTAQFARSSTFANETGK